MYGLAILFGSVITILALGVAAVGVVLPAVIGFSDPLGFNRWQRLALKGAGLLLVGGIVVSAALGILTQLTTGIVLYLLLVALAVLIVCGTVVWRLSEAFVRLLSRTFDGRAS